MESKLAELLQCLDVKDEDGSLLSYESGVRDLLVAILYNDSEFIDELIEECK